MFSSLRVSREEPVVNRYVSYSIAKHHAGFLLDGLEGQDPELVGCISGHPLEA